MGRSLAFRTVASEATKHIASLTLTNTAIIGMWMLVPTEREWAPATPVGANGMSSMRSNQLS
jgi:hypothetical protein